MYYAAIKLLYFAIFANITKRKKTGIFEKMCILLPALIVGKKLHHFGGSD